MCARFLLRFWVNSLFRAQQFVSNQHFLIISCELLLLQNRCGSTYLLVARKYSRDFKNVNEMQHLWLRLMNFTENTRVRSRTLPLPKTSVFLLNNKVSILTTFKTRSSLRLKGRSQRKERKCKFQNMLIRTHFLGINMTHMYELFQIAYVPV